MDSNNSGSAWVIRGAVAVGLVLSALVFAGLVLNLTTGLTAKSWAVATGVLAALAAAGLLAVRYARRREAGRTWRGEQQSVTQQDLRSSLPAAGYLLLALGLAAGAVVLAARSAGWQHTPGFAQLWLVPGKGTATLGVRNNYPDAETFRLVLRRGGAITGDWQLRLAASQSWQQVVAAPAGTPLAARLISPSQALSVEVTP